MAASILNSSAKYRDYAQYLRASADRLDMAVAPGRLRQLQARVSAERTVFHLWVIIWSLLALISVTPLTMLLVAHLDWSVPAFIATQCNALYDNLRVGTQPTNADLVAIASAVASLSSVVIGFGPIISYGSALEDIEYANRTLRSIERD